MSNTRNLGELLQSDGEVPSAKIDSIAASKLTGTIADARLSAAKQAAALPLTGGAMTGAITTNSTFDTRDVATDGTKLDTIATNANAYVHPNHSGDVVSAADGATTIQVDAVDIPMLSATGTASNTTFLRGDNAWAVPIGGVTSVNSVTGAITAAHIATAVEAASGSNTFTDADHSKLNAIETSATADQTNAEIKAAVEAASDSNTFTDADHTKLNAIEASADVTDTTNVVAALSAGTGVGISGSGVVSVTAVALTTVQTASSQSAHLALTAQEGDIVVRSDENKTYCHNGGSAGNMTDYTLLATPTDTVLSVAGNTGAVSAAQIATAVEAASNSNTFTDADHTKLNAIEASATADQTAAQIKTALEDGIDSVHYVDGSIDTVHIAGDAITALKIADDVINATHIEDGQILTAALGDDAVTAAKLANSINTDIATGVTGNTTANAALPKAGGTMTGQILAPGGSAGAPSFAFGAQSSTGMYKPGTNQLYFSVGGTRKIRLESSQMVVETALVANTTTTLVGDLTVDTNTLFVDASENKVGIGTTSPADMLHVSGGNIRLRGASNSASTVQIEGAEGQNAILYLMADEGDDHADYSRLVQDGSGLAFQYYSSGFIEAMRINSSGNVGIGTTSPGYPLEVAHGTPEISLEDTSSSATFRLKLDGTEAKIKNYGSNGDLLLQTTGTGRIITNVGSAISYAIGSDYKIHSDSDEVVVEDTSGDGETWLTMKTFVAVKSGKLRFRWDAYIQSGTYYWAGEFHKNGTLMKKSDNSTDAHHGYSQSLASGFSDSVHNYRTFQMDLGDVAAGDVITYKMAASTGGGSIQSGNGQDLYCKNFAAYSTTPTIETHFPYTNRPPPFTATGGTITTDGNYKIHTFTSSGTFAVTDAAHGVMEYMLVAGGGGGGSSLGYCWSGGGGGAGGYIANTAFSVSAQNYSVVIGAGGGANAKGGDSSFAGNTAEGGGFGGKGNYPGTGTAGGSGGSGGGGGQSTGVSGGGGRNAGQGNVGGPSRTAAGGGYAGGGGGGVGGAGATAFVAGAGGVNDITGSNVTYAAGGGGPSGASASTPNTGNGGDSNSCSPYSGASGVFIVRYLV